MLQGWDGVQLQGSTASRGEQLSVGDQVVECPALNPTHLTSDISITLHTSHPQPQPVEQALLSGGELNSAVFNLVTLLMHCWRQGMCSSSCGLSTWLVLLILAAAPSL